MAAYHANFKVIVKVIYAHEIMQIWLDTTNAFSQFTGTLSVCAKVYAQWAFEVTHWKLMLQFFIQKSY